MLLRLTAGPAGPLALLALLALARLAPIAAAAPADEEVVEAAPDDRPRTLIVLLDG